MVDKRKSEHFLVCDQQSGAAELPPGVDAPSSTAERERIAAGNTEITARVEAEIRRLADEVGGWGRLRELVTRLQRTAHSGSSSP